MTIPKALPWWLYDPRVRDLDLDDERLPKVHGAIMKDKRGSCSLHTKPSIVTWQNYAIGSCGSRVLKSSSGAAPASLESCVLDR